MYVMYIMFTMLATMKRVVECLIFSYFFENVAVACAVGSRISVLLLFARVIISKMSFVKAVIEEVKKYKCLTRSYSFNNSSPAFTAHMFFSSDVYEENTCLTMYGTIENNEISLIFNLKLICFKL